MGEPNEHLGDPGKAAEPDTETPAQLRKRVMPTLPGVLEGFGASTHVDSGPAFLSVFLDDRLLFLTPKGFFDGLNAAAGPVALLP